LDDTGKASTIIDFSIITPVYNGEKYIRETIESVLKNTKGVSFEYIVVNDGSTDSTAQVIEDYKENCRIILQNNSGESSAVNRGIEASSGRYLLVVSADDPLVSPQLFSRAKELLESGDDIVCVYPDWNRIDSNSKLIRQELTEEFSLETLLCDGICIPGPGAVFLAEIAKKIGGRKLEWKYVGDYDFWLRLSVYGKFQRIPLFLAQWREHPDSTSLKMRGKSMALERIKVIENFLESNPVDSQKSRKALSTAYYQASLLSYFSKEVSGRRYMLISLYFSRFKSIKFTLPEVLFISGLPLTRFIWNLNFLLKIRKYYETNR
jgi:glycosyltransferase involved in cell wall biosynthesis